MKRLRWLRRKFRDQGGWTLIEMMIVVAVVGIITPALITLFLKLTQGMAADEMRTQLQTMESNTLLRVGDRLSANRHFFQQGSTFFNQLQLTNAPATLAGSIPATLQTAASFSPGTSTPAYFGNCILMAAYDSPTTIGTQAYYAPLTIYSTASIPVTYTNGAAATVTLDAYRFYFYYLSTVNPHPLTNFTTYRLVEWRSVQFADFYEISNLTDSKLETQVVKWLATSGSVTTGSQPITLAYDPTQSAPASAFYTLTAAGVTAASTAQTILQSDYTYMTHNVTGILSNGFKYGVSSDSPPWKYVPSVPIYAAPASQLGGFEVGLEGTTTGEQVLLRLLVVAQGAAPTVIYNDMTTIDTIRDVW